jgi:hypothetical protein
MFKHRLCGAFIVALALPGTAQAWSFSASGSAVCDQSSGQYVVTWTIDNSSEPQQLTITSSNRSAVPGGSTVPAHGSSAFSESLAGTMAGSLQLTVSGNWPSDSRGRTRSASVSLAGDCQAPPPPPPPPPPPSPPPPVVAMSDDCPNLPDLQGSVPEGMVKDESGNCVSRPTAPPPTVVQVQPPAPEPAPQPAPQPAPAEPSAGVLGATFVPKVTRDKRTSRPAKKAKRPKAKIKMKAKVKGKVAVKRCAPGTRLWQGRCAPIVKGKG